MLSFLVFCFVSALSGTHRSSGKVLQHTRGNLSCTRSIHVYGRSISHYPGGNVQRCVAIHETYVHN